MQLVGYLDSPFVRRVAVSMKFLDIPFEHRELSIFRDYDAFRALHPCVKVPTMVLDDGNILIDSNLIIDHLEQHVAGRSLMPSDRDAHASASARVGVATAAMEKVAQVIYETGHRPAELQHGPWLQRVEQQLHGAVALMEQWAADWRRGGQAWMYGDDISQADISIAILWRFAQHIDAVRLDPADFPSLAAFSAQAEALPEFISCPLSE